ncbi:MAG: hypothetical protein JNK15_17575 [Planctomycetes bacterium]|nr:hypothetical protein [Planctomycetota bacterium]
MRGPACLLVPLACTSVAWAQSLESLRQQLRTDLRQAHFAQTMLGLVLLADELELSGASYEIDNATNTELQTVSMPFHSRQSDGDGPRLYYEGTLGFAQAKERVDDIYQGTSPGNEAAITTRWRTYGVLGGLGVELPVAAEWTATPIVDVGVGRIENDTDYAGPGSAAIRALADGIAFNWDALAATGGLAGRVDWRHTIDDERRLDVIARYDIRWTDTFDADDSAQEFTARSQLFTLHGDLTGPTGMLVQEKPVQWQASAAFRAFPEGDLFGVDHYVQFGGALLVPTGDRIPYGSGLAFSAAVMLGEDFFGWTIGGRLMF